MPQDKRIARWLAQLARLYTGEQRRLTAKYRRIVSRLEPERLQLTASMERLERAGNLTPQNVRDLAAYGRLLARTADELNGYGRVLESSLARISDGSIQLGTEAAWNLSAEMAGRLGEVVRTAYRQPDTDAIRQLVRYIDSDAMRANLAKFGQAGADNLADVLLAGLGSGQGASAVARLLTNWYAVPLAWSENMTRTLGNWSYRMASHASYRLNSDIVEGWYWSSSLDRRTCFPAGTVVRTQAGNKPIEAVSVGDRVLTNSGRYRAVYDTMRRTYSGKAITIKAGGSTVTMTADHPVLVDRLGKRYWVTADHCKVGDVVFVSPDDTPNGDNHFGCEVSIERRVGDADYSVAGGNQFGNLPGVRLRASVPIDAVHFDGEVAAGNEKVSGIPRKRRFLLKRLAQQLQAQAEVHFRLRFAGIASIARWRAKLLVRLSRHHAKLLATGQTSVDDRRASAHFRTILPPVIARAERLAAAGAFLVDRAGGFAGSATGAIPIRVGPGNSELFPADDTRFGDRLAGIGTLSATEPTRPEARVFERLSTSLATALDPLIRSRVIAAGATVHTAAASSPSVGGSELFPTVVADSFFHAPIISIDAHHIQCEVYDLSVETDHTFVANGVLVHNCLSCVSMHGTFHTNDEILNDHHNGRCSPIPRVRGGLVADSIGTGEAWFDGLSDAQKREIMGPGRYDLYTSGRWDWRAVSKPYNDPVYGEMLRAATLTEMRGR